MGSYRLTPINLGHESWNRSTVKKGTIRVLAHDCTRARNKAAKATEILHAEFQTDDGHYTELNHSKSPWQLADVTLCEPDDSAAPMPPNHIVLEDGSQLPIYRNVD